jgi:hypothetical protein
MATVSPRAALRCLLFGKHGKDLRFLKALKSALCSPSAVKINYKITDW